MSDLQTNLFEAVESLVSRQIESTPIDETITATVTLVRNVEVGEYKVTYKGDTFSAFSLDPLTVYRKGEDVYVLVPKGDYSSKKIILGKAAYNDIVSYADRQAMSNQWKTRGPNWLSNEWYWRDNEGDPRSDNRERKAGIIATTMGEEHLITSSTTPNTAPPPSWREYIFYRDADENPEPKEPPLTPARQAKILRPTPTNRPNLESLQQVDEQFQIYANNYDHVMISANFETNFSNTHSSGEYGILVECWIANPKYGKENYPDAPERVLTTLRFSFNDFNGAPYQFNQSTPQRAVFPVVRGALKGLVRVCLFQDDGWNTDIVPIYIKDPTPEVSYDVAKGATPVRDRNNIFATNVDIRWCENINLTDSLFWLKIDTPRGTSLYNASDAGPANPSIPLEARLFYGSEEVTARETCKFIWFRQKYSATMDKVNPDKDRDEFGRTWWDYGGNGWAPVEKIMAPASEEPFFGEGASGVNQYRFNDPEWHQTLNVGIEVVPWQWLYKVVCVYNPVATNLEDKLERSSKEVILFETELIVNESSIHDFELPKQFCAKNLMTIFLRTRNNGLPWDLDKNYNPQEPDYPDPKKDWWCRWWIETPSGLYEPVPHTGDPRFQKGKISINDYLHYDAVTFKAQVYGKKNPTGATKEERIGDAAQVWPYPDGPDQSQEQNEFEIANIERTLLKSRDLALLVDWEGITHHTYNSDGSILLQSSVGSEFYLWARLFWVDNSISDYSIEWIAPDGVTRLRHHSKYPGGPAVGSGFSMDDSMMYDMWVGADNIVHYKVRQKYDINKTKNTFTLRVVLVNGRAFEYAKEITFSKAGQNGTQGSEWEARIWPTNPQAAIGTPDLPGFESWTEEIRKYPRPLVVNGNFDGTSSAYTRNDAYKLFLRPFIYKNGKRIEELADADSYTYRVYWDARYPNVKDTSLTARYAARRNSFFEFVSVGTPIDDPGDFTFGPTNPTGIQNLQAVTRHDDTAGSTERTYGAVEVRWRNQATINGVSIKNIDYDFVIRAQVDIFQHGTLIGTIFSYWPIDVLFTNGVAIDTDIFDPNKINTNWPQFVLYNPTGYGPEVEQDYLRFYYGEKAWNQFDPLPFTATPINQTTRIQEVKKESDFRPASWRLYPRPYYFFEECANGAIATDFTLDPDFMPPISDSKATSTAPNPDTGWTSPNPDMDGWNQCTYVRPVVYMLNAFGNTDINGWDGKSIDINDERGTIFAPTIGAGWKDPFTNKFSGVIMGIDTSQSKQTYQNIFGGFSQDDIKKNPYMTGLFGYQDGVSSFGILENGTAYFGRADRGGRIIIDGFNAQIYGGVQGDISGGRDMDMHNRMRLSFIDFEGVAQTQGIGDTDGSDTDPTAERKYLETDGVKINTGSYNVGASAALHNRFFPFFANTSSPLSLLGQNAGFGSGRGAGTPAIEIGSYKNYIDSGGVGDDLIRKITPAESQSWYGNIMKLEIPGYRKFLVTYDGTLYAMNAFVKGNIVGSNIIGSQFFNHDGSWGVDETGNQWSGSGYNRFEERFVEVNGNWSYEAPAVGPARGVSFILSQSPGLYTSLPANDIARDVYDQVEAPFFVANDGRVFCQEIHVSGRSSINIGGFHVVPYGAGGSGDMYSFGVSHFIGGYGSGMPGLETIAVQGWGAFYLRGKLTNLGPVYLGSVPEKTTGTGDVSANALNSPFSLTPPNSWWGELNPNPKLPVEAGLWPLYFRLGADSLDQSRNGAWVCLSSATGEGGAESNNYMPAFARRAVRTLGRFDDNDDAEFAQNVFWRIDQIGQWTDAILFTTKMWFPTLNDQTPLSATTHALGYLGWYQRGDLWAFALKNMNGASPDMVLETVRHMRISSGQYVGSRLGSATALPNNLIVETWKNSTTRSGVMSLTSGSPTSVDRGAISATTVGLIGRRYNRVNNESSEDIEAFLFINGIGFDTADPIVDEKGSVVDVVPSNDITDNNANARIWMKAVGIAIDGAETRGGRFDEPREGRIGVATANNNSTLRINRSWSGADDAGGMPDVTGGGRTGSNFLGLSSGTIMLRSRGVQNGASDTIHIISGGDSRADNQAGTNEIFLNGANGTVRLNAATELSFSVNKAAHNQPDKGIRLTSTHLRVVDYAPEFQEGIYARFA